MNNLETIIKYLGKEMDAGEITRFELQLESDEKLREELKRVQQVWDFIGKQLSLQDLPGEADRENFLAEVVAAIEIDKFRNKEESEQTEAFRKRLKSIMDDASADMEPGASIHRKKGRKSNRARIVLLFLGAAAVLSLIILPYRDLDDLTTLYYNPPELEHISDMYSLSRSEETIACKLFFEGEYVASRKAFEAGDQLQISDPASRFIYALSCYETGSVEKSITLLASLRSTENADISCDVDWYLALILIKKNDPGQAIQLLQEISEGKCKYVRKADKLLRKMKGADTNG